MASVLADSSSDILKTERGTLRPAPPTWIKAAVASVNIIKCFMVTFYGFLCGCPESSGRESVAGVR